MKYLFYRFFKADTSTDKIGVVGVMKIRYCKRETSSDIIDYKISGVVYN